MREEPWRKRDLTEGEWAQLREGLAPPEQLLLDRVRTRGIILAQELRETTVSTRSKLLLVTFGATATLLFPSLLTIIDRGDDRGATPVSSPSSSPAATTPAPSASPTVAPTQVPSASPSAPVVVNYPGTEAPVIVVMQPPEEARTNPVLLVSAISGGIVAVISAIGWLVYMLRRQPGDRDLPPTPAMPSS